ncbi:2-oxoglutarate dehydrogenase, E2 component, dihydrolipoamide succinyltransferase [Pseudonocardia acaciae]|uniref:2-oxoglutarate dehydrogenase, E2 component, dihydrolipoamide succinyltransferase n=1 Tax=Pseudonocardia acaciae TaxID=551276 RepID=UPI00048FF008|nr:2-oxoglutarate dehydrogenase, E2 component, dihydrolipoamide succinyltransferase [Pseudonocardia acaciae]
MAFSVQMPALGESVTEGTITRWLKQEGDRVEVDEPLLEVSTDKVDTEIPSPAAGVLERIVVAEDETVEVGAELAVIADGAGGSGSGSGSESAAPAAQEAPEAPAAAEPQPERRAEPEPAQAAEQPAAAQTGSGGDGTPVTMPALGESVTEGTVTRWLKQVGDRVEVDEPLLEVSTDKVDTEIPSPVAGTVLEIVAGEDETVEVGGRLAVVGSGSAAPSAPAPPAEPTQPPAQPAQSAPAEPAQASGSPWREPESAPAPAQPATDNGSAPDTSADGGPYVTPLVRKLAAQHNVDLTTIKGTGVGGRIRKQDVLAAAEKPAPAPSAPAPSAPAPAAAPLPAASAPPAPSEPSAAEAAKLRGTTQKLPRLRKVIAQRMTESLQVSAQLTAMLEVDVTRVARLRQLAKADFEAREGVKLTFLSFFVKAAIDSLKLFPQVNASIDTAAGEVTYHDAEHIGIAVDTDRGLVVPVIHDAGNLNLAGIARAIADLALRTRTNKARPDELSGGTFTVTNIGSRGSLTDTPIINQPQVAILGTGAVVKRPVVVTDALGNDAIAIRSIANLVLTYDHRLVDGADAGRFLSAVKRRVETAAFEADLGLNGA